MEEEEDNYYTNESTITVSKSAVAVARHPLVDLDRLITQTIWITAPQYFGVSSFLKTPLRNIRHQIL